jgi:hypothetical protein
MREARWGSGVEGCPAVGGPHHLLPSPGCSQHGRTRGGSEGSGQWGVAHMKGASPREVIRGVVKPEGGLGHV